MEFFSVCSSWDSSSLFVVVKRTRAAGIPLAGRVGYVSVKIVISFTVSDGGGRRSYIIYRTSVPLVQIELSYIACSFIFNFSRQCGRLIAAGAKFVDCGQRQLDTSDENKNIVAVNSVASDSLYTHLCFVLRLPGVLEDCVCQGGLDSRESQRACAH